MCVGVCVSVSTSYYRMYSSDVHELNQLDDEALCARIVHWWVGH